MSGERVEVSLKTRPSSALLLMLPTLLTALCVNAAYRITLSTVGLAIMLLVLLVLTIASYVSAKRARPEVVDLSIPRAVLLGDSTTGHVDVKLGLDTLTPIRSYARYGRGLRVSCDLRKLSSDSVRVVLQVQGLHVGEHKLDRVVIVSEHRLKLVEVELVLHVNADLLVEPRTVVLARAIISGAGSLPGLSDLILPRPARSGLEYYGSRPFMPGDDPRFIDWKATARTGKLHVKEFYSSGLGRTQVILNMRDCTDELELDLVAATGLSLLYSLLRSGLEVELAVITREEARRLLLKTDRDLVECARLMLRLFTEELHRVSAVTSRHVELVELLQDRASRGIDIVYVTCLKEGLHEILKLVKTRTPRRLALLVPCAGQDVTHLVEILRREGVNTIYAPYPNLIHKYVTTTLQ